MAKPTREIMIERIATETGVKAEAIEAMNLPDKKLQGYFNRVAKADGRALRANILSYTFMAATAATVVVSGALMTVGSSVRGAVEAGLFGLMLSVPGIWVAGFCNEKSGNLRKEPENVANELHKHMSDKIYYGKKEDKYIEIVAEDKERRSALAQLENIRQRSAIKLV